MEILNLKSPQEDFRRKAYNNLKSFYSSVLFVKLTKKAITAGFSLVSGFRK